MYEYFVTRRICTFVSLFWMATKLLTIIVRFKINYRKKYPYEKNNGTFVTLVVFFNNASDANTRFSKISRFVAGALFAYSYVK